MSLRFRISRSSGIHIHQVTVGRQYAAFGYGWQIVIEDLLCQFKPFERRILLSLPQNMVDTRMVAGENQRQCSHDAQPCHPFFWHQVGGERSPRGHLRSSHRLIFSYVLKVMFCPCSILNSMYGSLAISRPIFDRLVSLRSQKASAVARRDRLRSSVLGRVLMIISYNTSYQIVSPLTKCK